MRESEFTQPREDCPEPDLWSAPDNESTEEEVTDLVYAMVRALKPKVVVETGSAWGFTTRRIGEALRENGRGTCYSIEIDKRRAEHVMKRVRDLPVVVLNMSTLDVTPRGDVDFAFIDSDPYIREQEITHFRPKLYMVHDTGPHHPWVNELNVEGIYLPTPRGVTIGQFKP